MAILTSEKQLREHLRKYFKEYGHFQPIETGAVASGVPDVNYCHQGKEFWIELKIVKGTRLEIRPTQVSWHIRRAQFGGRNFVLAADKHENIWLWHGRYIKELMDFGIKAEVPYVKLPQNSLEELLQHLNNNL